PHPSPHLSLHDTLPISSFRMMIWTNLKLLLKPIKNGSKSTDDMKIMTQYKDGNYAIEVARGILEDRIGDYTDKYDQVFYLADKNVYQLHKNGKLSFI